jgi:predicted transcriptional regulator
MTYYKKKRTKSGLSKTDIAKELGLTYERYNAIERGDVKMPSILMDKFNEIINRGNTNTITKTENKIKADAFWDEMKSLNENGERKLYVKMKEFNIKTIQQLATLLGYKSAGIISSYVTGQFNVADEFKKRLYNFFNDELNIQVPDNKSQKKKPRGKYAHEEPNPELDKYYNETDFKELLRKYKLSNKEIGDYVNCHGSVISKMVCKTIKPSYRIIGKVKEYLDNYENGIDMSEFVSENVEPTKEPKEVTITVPTPEIVKRYTTELGEIDETIKILTDRISELKARQRVCNEVLSVIEELKKEL